MGNQNSAQRIAGTGESKTGRSRGSDTQTFTNSTANIFDKMATGNSRTSTPKSRPVSGPRVREQPPASKKNPQKGSVNVIVLEQGKSYKLLIPSTAQMKHVKEMLKAQHAIEVSLKQFVYGDYILDDKNSLQDVNFKSGDTIRLIPSEEEDKSPLSRLLKAVGSGDLGSLTDILKTGIDVNVSGKAGTYKGRKVLSVASERGHLKIVKFLRGVGASLNAKDDNGLTPLLVAAREGHLDICRFLVDGGADIDATAEGMKLIHHAAVGGHVHVLEYLRDFCNIHELSEEHLSALHFSAQYGKLEAVYWLVEVGINFNIKDKRGQTAEDYAREKSHKDITTYLYHWANLQQKKFLQDAALGNLESVKAFFNIEIDIECKSQNEGDWGQRAIHVAALRGHTEVVNALLYAGAQREAKDDMGNTPMHHAASEGQIAVMKLLKNEGCKVGVCNNYNMTPLHFTAKTGQLAAASWLLAQGVPAYITSNDGLTAADMAKQENHQALVDILQKHLGTRKKEDTSEDVVKVGRMLGAGSFGEVFIATMNSREIVVKKIRITDKNQREIDFSEREVHLLKTLKHPNIVTYMGDQRKNGFLFIMMEYCSGGDLNQRIMQQKATGRPFEEKLVIIWTSRIVSALTFIHSRNILHRDLKPHNIFLSDSGAIKLGDFGLAKIMDDSMLAQSFVGAPAYMSPEVLSSTPYNDKADMWSFGCILYELAALKMGFPYVKVKVPGNYSEDYKQLVTSLLSLNPDKRPSSAEVWRLPFLKPSHPNTEQLQQRQRQLQETNRELERSMIAMTGKF